MRNEGQTPLASLLHYRELNIRMTGLYCILCIGTFCRHAVARNPTKRQGPLAGAASALASQRSELLRNVPRLELPHSRALEARSLALLLQADCVLVAYVQIQGLGCEANPPPRCAGRQVMSSIPLALPACNCEYMTDAFRDVLQKCVPQLLRARC